MRSFRPPRDWKGPLLGRVGRLGLMFITLFVLLLVSAVPLGFWSLSDIRPAFVLMAVFYWAVFFPHLLPPPAVFMLGIFLDLLGDWPLGLNALVLVLAQMVMKQQRKFLLGQRFIVLWAAFMLVAMLAGLFEWGFFSLFYWGIFPVKSMLVSAGLSGLIFPLFAVLLHMAGKTLTDMSAMA